MSPITVAVVGATGLLGVPVTKALLSKQYHPASISRVIILTRDPSSAKSKELIDLGAEAVQASDETIFAEHLKGVDVLVSALTSTASIESRNKYAKAAADAGVNVYIPPEFGVDPRGVDVDYFYWKDKLAHRAYAEKIGGDRMKVVSVHTGGFLDIIIAPFFGFDTKNNVFTSFGDPSVKGAVTALHDIGLALGQLSILATANPASVPDHVRIFGDCKSTQEIAAIIGKESGETVEVKGDNYAQKKAEFEATPAAQQNVMDYLRLVFASGQVDWTSENDNELVNPGEKNWKWKTITDLAKETKGKPPSY